MFSTRTPHTTPVIDEAFGFSRGLGEERLERRAGVEVLLQRGLVVARQPLDHLVELGLRASLALDLRHVVGIDRGDAGREDPMHLCGYSRSSETAMSGSETQGWRSTHHTSTPGRTADLSSRVPAFTATTPAVFASSDTIGDPHDGQNRRRT